MAEKNAKNELEKPAGATTPPAEDAAIHVIPEKFYGAALKQKVKKDLPEPAAPMPGVGAPGQPQPPQQPGQPQGGKKTGLIIAIIVIVLLLGGGAAAYFLFFAGPSTPEPVCGDNVCAAPAETSASCPADCGEPPPVCGDNACEAPTESPFTCAEDCGPPPPVCGDTQCEGDESPQTCPVDCGPPPPECGDDICHESEDFRSCPADCEAPEPVVAQDTDSDGITDVEESQIYGSRLDDTDSDNDSFVDLNEILNLFDPSKPDPAKLIDAPGVTLYRNVDFGFDIFRPQRWTVNESEATDSVTFTAPTGESISVSVKRKAADMALIDWVLSQSPDQSQSELEVLRTRQGYDQVLSEDRRTAYVGSGTRVFVVVYDLGDELEIRYRVTFTMMINSFIALEVDEAEPAPEPEPEPEPEPAPEPEPQPEPEPAPEPQPEG